MKKLISLFLLSLLALSMYGCEKKSSESEMISTSINNNAVHDEIKDISGNVIESDGVIASLGAGELVKKLSMLQNGTTLDDMIKIFGKEPFMVKEANTPIFKYFSGDVTITLWGTELFQATVECMDSVFSIDLGITNKATD